MLVGMTIWESSNEDVPRPPDGLRPTLADEARRQSALVAEADRATDDQAFVDVVPDDCTKD